MRFRALEAAIASIVLSGTCSNQKSTAFWAVHEKKFERNRPSCTNSIAGLVREC